MFAASSTSLDGVWILDLPRYQDGRGSFIKVLHKPAFLQLGKSVEFSEQFYTTSKKNVLRGMHCQFPPHEHFKLVVCVSGRILDVIVDLRRNALTYKKCFSIELDGSSGKAIYIPPGCAHGFLTLSDEATTLYNVTSVHAPESDGGVNWRSIGFNWPCADPVTSRRDEVLPSISDFLTPF